MIRLNVDGLTCRTTADLLVPQSISADQTPRSLYQTDAGVFLSPYAYLPYKDDSKPAKPAQSIGSADMKNQPRNET